MMERTPKNSKYILAAVCLVLGMVITSLFFLIKERVPSTTNDHTPSLVAEELPDSVHQVLRENRSAIETGLKGEKTGNGVFAMERVLMAWDPIGFRADTLTDLLGAPSVREDGVLTYRFDSGLGGVVWQFTTGADDKITKTQRYSMW